MSEWIRDIEPEDFLKWANKNPKEFVDFWEESGMLRLVEDAEGEDFFGTEGFDKRYG